MVVLQRTVLTVSTLGGCAAIQVSNWESMVVFTELSFNFWCSVQRTDF